MKKRRASAPRKHAGHRILGVKGTAVIAVLSICVLVGTAVYTRSYLQSGQMAAVISSALVTLTNHDRTHEDLGTLTVSPVLTAAAQAKADDMAKNGYFAHVSPDGKDSWYWFKQQGYAFTYAGENLAVDFSDSDAVEEAWMNSPTHRANILNARFTEIGIATAQGTYEGRKTTFVVQMFGAPATAATGTVEALNAPHSASEIAVATSKVLGESTAGAMPATSMKKAAVGTTTPAAEPAAAPAPASAPLATIAAAPAASLRGLYLLAGGLVLVALISVTRFTWSKTHLPYIAAAVCLVLLMTGLYAAAGSLLFSAPTLTAAAAFAAP